MFPMNIPTNSSGSHAGMANMLVVVKDENSMLMTRVTHLLSQVDVLMQENVRLKSHNAMLHRKIGQLRSMDMTSSETDESTTSPAQRRSGAPSPASTTAFTTRSPGTTFTQSLNESSIRGTPTRPTRMANLDSLLTTRQGPVYPKRAIEANDEATPKRIPDVSRMTPFVKRTAAPAKSTMSPFVIPTIPPRNFKPVTTPKSNNGDVRVPLPRSAPTRQDVSSPLRPRQSPRSKITAQPPSDRFLMDTAPGPSSSSTTPPTSQPSRMTFRIPEIPPRKVTPNVSVTPRRQDTIVPQPRSAPVEREEPIPLRARELPCSVKTIRSPAFQFSMGRSFASSSPNALTFVVADELPFRTSPSPTAKKIVVPEPEHVLIKKYLPSSWKIDPTDQAGPSNQPGGSNQAPPTNQTPPPPKSPVQQRKRSMSAGTVPTTPLEPLRVRELNGRRSRSKSPKKQRTNDGGESTSRMLSVFNSNRINFYTVSPSIQSPSASTSTADAPSTSRLTTVAPSRPSPSTSVGSADTLSTSTPAHHTPTRAINQRRTVTQQSSVDHVDVRSPPPTLTPVNMEPSPVGVVSTPVDLSIRRGPWSLAASLRQNDEIFRPWSPSPSTSVLQSTATPVPSVEMDKENAGGDTGGKKASTTRNRESLGDSNIQVIGPVIEID